MGGTSYAVLQFGSDAVVDNSLRSRDIRNNSLQSRDIRNRALRARDVGRESLGSGVIKESTLGLVPRAASADRLGRCNRRGSQAWVSPRNRCDGGGLHRRSPRTSHGFLGAINICSQAGRGLATMPQLDAFLRVNGPATQAEWTAVSTEIPTMA